MTNDSSLRTRPVPTRLAGAATVAAGAMFLLYPAVRPAGDAAEVVASGAWVASHFFAMIGFILVPFGLYALLQMTDDRRARYALVTSWIGAGLVLPYYGAEDFGLHVIAARAVREPNVGFTELAEAFRFDPLAAGMFAAGLILLAVAGVLAALAVWRSGTLQRWSGVPFAAGLLLFFPQFYTPAAVRTAHGVLLAVGCVWLGMTLWRSRRI
ncbi:hypothetical protein JOF56_010333 [Kibdelosporangium banguiense]|uniref:DUF4386 domain-containing protein n=1 Tax=Kibdelosporangium banguiense TaxID=1365924 RepID=A0ABS4U136_9PSEU|nr:hypothetical protein [Kibdelosporangium banguiense]MBP2329948.1 hypothetical protein [Kibdelosporangium banguiense]